MRLTPPAWMAPVVVMAVALLALACDAREPREATFDLEIVDGALSEEDSNLEVKLDDKITIRLTSDETVNYHLHGYDVEGVVGPDAPVTIQFDAYATGSFPLTIHHAEPAMTAMDGHHHGQAETVEATEGMTVSVEAVLDPVAGVNVRLATESFTFAPEQAGLDHVPGVGHAHLYLDGVKLGRLYGEHYHIGDIGPGERTIRVTLNANTHASYAHGPSVVGGLRHHRGPGRDGNGRPGPR